MCDLVNESVCELTNASHGFNQIKLPAVTTSRGKHIAATWELKIISIKQRLFLLQINYSKTENKENNNFPKHLMKDDKMPTLATSNVTVLLLLL